MEPAAMPDLVIAIVQGRVCIRQQFGEPRLALDERPRIEILAVEVQKIEQEEDERGGVAAVGRRLDHANGGDAVGTDAAQFAVEIGLLGAKRRDVGGDLRIFVRPVKPGACEQPQRSAIEARMHAVAVKFDFMQPVRSVRRLVDELGELWLDPLRQTRRSGAGLTRYRPRHAGSVRRLRCWRMRL